MDSILAEEICAFSMGQKVYFILKRIVDIVISLVGVICFILIAMVVKISYMLHGDFQAILFRQIRIGKNGKEFALYKFRTMVPNAEQVLKELLKQEKYKKEWDLNQKLSKDPRITKMGNFLRKTSLDEIPQFINVLKGDMSLIGPRPLVRGELDAHHGNHELYERIRPGITGWWACNGRSATTYEKRLELEYYYVKNCSILLDMKCIFKTIAAVVFKTGAK